MIFNKNKSRFIAGWEIDFENPDELKKILVTQGIDNNGFEFFRRVQTATEIEIKKNQIVKVIQHSEGSREVERKKIQLPIDDWVDREVFFLVRDPNGLHKLGGNCPPDFILPKHSDLKTPFIYIGSIDTSDKEFKWLNLPRLDLAYPIYECNSGVYLDYNDPKHPVILNPDTFNDSWYDDSTKGVEKVLFNEQRFSVSHEIDVELSDKVLLCGVPLWYQAPEIPTCPNTGEVMNFVCTVNSDNSIGLKDSKGIENLPFSDYLIFGDYGCLYVFYHPVSKVLYLNIQF